jgi:hypothetical protein
MAVVYINPTAPVNGSGGSLVDPRNTWPTTGWTAGNQYVQLAGTTFTGVVAPNASGTAGAGRILIGTCDQSGAIVLDGSARAILSGGADQDAIDLGRSGTRNFFDVASLDLRGGTGTSRSAVYGLGGTETTLRSNTISNCLITAQAGAGVNARGDVWSVSNCVLANCLIDGVIIAGSNLLIEQNTIYNNDMQLVNGDGIQVATAASVGVCVIRKNNISHPLASPKQGIIFQGASGTALIEGNTITGGGQSAIAVGLPGGIARRNRVFGFINAFSILSPNVRIESNLAVGGESGVIFTVDEATGALIYGNTFGDLTANGIYNVVAADLATWTARNNLFFNALRGIDIASAAATVQSHNAFWQCSTNIRGGVSGGNDITADPLLTDTYRPKPGSPLLGAGTHLGYTRDIERKQRPNPPSIGAYDVATLRTPE